MKEPYRRENLHSIISKISGSVEASHPEEELTVDNNKDTVGNDKADSEMKIADKQLEPMKNMFSKEIDGSDHGRNDNDAIRQNQPTAGCFNCQLCHIGFLTKRELQLHVMCHGIYITDDSKAVKKGRTKSTDDQENNSQSSNDKEVGYRKSPVIQTNTVTRKESSNDCEENKALSPTYDYSAADDASKMEVESTGGEVSNSSTGSATVNSDGNYGKIVDVLSLATATRGFKEPGSIWCSLCKCTVDKGHVCKVHQTSYHADKNEEGFTCELCGRYYNQKRKLRTHLRNRHKGFRLQEDEGYMCWQCWQAFPEIKILEEHIVAVHGHESRRQNSTWRPFTQPSTLPSPGEATDEQSAALEATESDNPMFLTISPPLEQQTTNLKRPGDSMTSPNPAKKSALEGSVCKDLLNIDEVNGKVVINDSFLITPEVPPCPQSQSPGCPSHTSPTTILPQSPTEMTTNQGGLQMHVTHLSDKVVTRSETAAYSEINKADINSRTNHGLKQNVIPPSTTSHNIARKKSPVPAQKLLQCPHCPETFSKKYVLQVHIHQQHGENMHCFYCSASCATKEALSSHIKTAHHDEVKSGKCPICQCKCLGELHQHIVQYHYKDLLIRKDKDRVLSTCPICHQTTTDTYHLRWHILKEHRGLQLPCDQPEASPEDTSSESGSSVASEGRLGGNEGPEKITGVNKGVMGTSEGNTARIEDDTREDSDGDDVEIVFVSDKNIDSNWSKPHGEKSHHPEVHPCPTPPAAQPIIASVCSIKKPADSSVSLDGSPKLKHSHHAADDVHSTTGQVEPKPIEGVSLNVPPGISPRVPPGVSLSVPQGVSPSVPQEVSPSVPQDVSPSVPPQAVSASRKYDYSGVSEEACIFCFNTFNDKETLVSHLRETHGWVDTFTCSICCYQGDTYLNVVEHFCVSHFHPIEDIVTQSEVKCLKCDIIFQDIVHLKKHAAALHSFQITASPTYNTFKCRHCNIIFDKQFDAQKHFDVYHLFRIRYKCESCRMGFTAKHDFQEHVTCNHPELVKSFCPVCGLGFEVNADLEEHVFEMHRRKAQFFCAQCGNEFADRFHVHMHIRSNCCVKWADSNFECLDCLTAFSSIAELRIHCNQRNCKASVKK